MTIQQRIQRCLRCKGPVAEGVMTAIWYHNGHGNEDRATHKAEPDGVDIVRYVTGPDGMVTIHGIDR